MKFLVVLAAVAAVATCWNTPSDQEVANQWQTFKAAHGKTYANDVEEAYRIKIFKENLIKIAKHNERFDAGKVTFKVGVNKFADMHTHEVTAKLNGYRGSVRNPDSPVHKEPADEELSLAWPRNKKVDWRTKGYVTPVKDQGNCGGCWSFSTTGAVEGQLFKKTGKLVALSEQNLIDCSNDYGNEGCDGGDMVPSFNYINDNGGIDTEEVYPYEGEGGACRYSKDNSGGAITGYVHVQAYSEKALQDAVKTVGPVAVAIDASNWSFQMYSSGIYWEETCTTSADSLDHAVLAVGYGSEGHNQDYWIVKNSWNTDWGEDGYIRMSRNRNNNCGIASDASYPTV